MPRVHGYRERRHQPFWDHLLRGTGAPTTPLNSSTKLFGNANVGNLAFTNLQVAGQLAADQTYVVLSLRVYFNFDGTGRREFYLQCSNQLIFTFTLGDKPQFVAPAWYHPAGGGVYGLDATTSVLNNGYPSQSAILKLARPVVIPVRQNIAVNAEFFPVGTTNVLTLINNAATDAQLTIAYFIDGLQTRDIQ